MTRSYPKVGCVSFFAQIYNCKLARDSFAVKSHAQVTPRAWVVQKMSHTLLNLRDCHCPSHMLDYAVEAMGNHLYTHIIR